MFSCKICGRDYGNRSSLTRHSHNHKQKKQHKCLTCGTVFSRRDLLSRHRRMHESLALSSPPLEASAYPSNSETVQLQRATRKRCHTACTHCRTSRTKCDGLIPCSVCKRSEKPCSYAPRSQRISRAPAVSSDDHTWFDGSPAKIKCFSGAREVDDNMEGVSPSEANVENDMVERTVVIGTPLDLSSDFPGSPNSDPAPSSTNYNAKNIIQMPHTANIFTEMIQMPNNAFNNFDGPSVDLLSDVTTWAWMHENMFLFPENDSLWSPFQPNSIEPVGSLATQASDPRNYETLLEYPVTTMNQQSLYQSADIAAENTTTYPAGIPRNPIKPRERNSRRNETLTHSIGIASKSQTNENQSRRSEISTTSEKEIIEELVEYSSNPSRLRDSRDTRANYWLSISRRIQKTFRLEDKIGDESLHVLQSFVELYLKHFAPLWPLLGMQNFDMDLLHPLLYLTLSSIGAMYSGLKECHFGQMMHEGVRKKLLAVAFEIEDLDDDFLWLGQARLLTQVAALYFGQRRAFSYAQHLGSVLAAQARRMDLFSAQAQQNSCLQGDDGESSTNERLAKWMHLEARKRLAFGILRAESYTSVLLNTRPFISSEEINLELPCDEGIWGSVMSSSSAYLKTVKRDRNLGGMHFADIVRVAMDRNEVIPSLEPIGHELLLFGLQNAVWRFCHDPGLFKRLTGNFNMSSRPEYLGFPQSLPLQGTHSSSFTSTSSSSSKPKGSLSEFDSCPDHLAAPQRSMDDLRLDCDRAFLALQKWKQSFEAGRTLTKLRDARNSILSSLLLYHTSYLRLHAPIPKLHLISYQLAGERTPPESVVTEVHEWTQSPGAKVAIQHASTLWSLIRQESQRPLSSRAQFNFLAFAGLHHAAAVMWAYASTHGRMEGSNETMYLGPFDKTDVDVRIRIDNEDVGALLDQFIKLYKFISPARWSSFAKAAVNLKDSKFPLPAGI